MKAYRPGQDRNNAHGAKAEKRLAKRTGGRQTPASGALQGAKGDVKLSGFMVESKATTKDSYRITLDTLCKVSDEATEVGELPALALQFTTPDGRLRRSGGWVLIREDTFRELFQ